jgi:hypothetical protein
MWKHGGRYGGASHQDRMHVAAASCLGILGFESRSADLLPWQVLYTSAILPLSEHVTRKSLKLGQDEFLPHSFHLIH